MIEIEKILLEFREEMLSEDITENTIRNYLADVRIFYKWYAEIEYNGDLRKMTFYHMNGYKEHMISNRRKKGTTINRSIQGLKNFCGFLIKKKLIKKNPAEKLKYMRQARKLRPKSLDKQAIHRLLSATAHSSHGMQKRNYAIIQILLQTGIRVSELINLEMRDVKIYQRSGEIRIVNAKGGKERAVPLNNAARRAIKEYWPKKISEDRKYVFLSKRGEKLTARAVQKIVKLLGDKGNIEEISPHILRHTFAINYLRSNPECLLELRNLLGHESLDTTSIYTVASKERLSKTVERSEQYING